MANEFTEFKVFLQLLDPEDQLYEIECAIDDLIKDNTQHFYIKRKYNRIQQPKKLRHDILQKL